MVYSFTTYVTTWGEDPLETIQNMINNNAVTSNSIIVLAFASFNFNSTDYIPGLNNLTMDAVMKITSLVHSHGGKISLSVGGATYPFNGSDLYNQPGDLANNINTILTKCNFDGVDFDIEDYYGNVPSNFANQAAQLINTLKSLNSNLYITLTTAAQAWSVGCYQQNLLNLTIGNLSAWQPMEYDIWLQQGTSYPDMIQLDIEYYINTWSVQPNKIILGLMPGLDDMKRDLTLSDTLNLTQYAKSNNLQGVMTWDADTDSTGIDGNAPYAYMMGIQSILNNNVNKKLHNHPPYNKKAKLSK